MPPRSRPPNRPPNRPPRRPSGPARPAAARASQSAHSPPPPDGHVRLAGLSAVDALFRQRPGQVERLYFVPTLKAQAAGFCQAMSRARKPFREVSSEELARIAGTVLHGGIVALAPPRPVLPFDAVMAAAWKDTAPFLLVLHGISNPHNLGAIVRTAAFFGIDRLIISDHPEQAGPSEAAQRVAEGGFEFVQLYKATRLPIALKRLRDGYRVLGTALGTGQPLAALQKNRPTVLVLGNEAMGLDAATLKACDGVVTLPGSGWVQSLNVAASAAIFFHAFHKTG
jgi:RNA methyltransferase, TrmH family